MTDYYVHHATTYQALFEDNVTDILNHIDANPGILTSQIASDLSLPAVLVGTVLAVLREQNLIHFGHDIDGTQHVWTVEDWAIGIKSNVIAARAWVLANDGSTTQQMASALGVHFALAVRLAQVLEREGMVKLTVTTVAL